MSTDFALRPQPTPSRPHPTRPVLLAMAFCASVMSSPLFGATKADLLSQKFETRIRPLLKQYCLDCHSTQKHKGDLDLERFDSAAEVVRRPRVWQGVVEQIGLGEMPPKEKPQLTLAEREELLGWVASALDESATARAGDPGPVVLRRLNNSEYNYTLRDLTGVPSLTPAKEFPADSAAGEGFMNTGNALVMSPALLTKYLDAAKEIAHHAVLLPDGIAFSASTSQRDWTEERLSAIRGFYSRFSVNGGGSAVNLQGIKFDTKDGGVIPLNRYLQATLELRDRRTTPTGDDFSKSAQRLQLSAKYLTTLWHALNATNESILLEPLRSQWRTADSASVTGMVQQIAQWQQALWRFTQIGHIGKRDGPTSWQMPVTPLAEKREVRLKLPPTGGSESVTFYLAASDAGDGTAGDLALWENPRLVAPGRTDLALRDVRAAVAVLHTHRTQAFESTAQCLAAAAWALTERPDSDSVTALANRFNVSPAVLASWLDCVGIGTGTATIAGHMTQRMESAQSYDFIKGWTGADALGVLANASTQHVRIPGNMKPHSVAVHPAPKRRVLVGWRSPVTGIMRISGVVQHAHPECGNGVTWSLELRRGRTRQTLTAGTSQGGKEITFAPIENLALKPGDVVSLSIGPRDGNHSCDLTAIDLSIVSATNTWNLAADVSPNLLAGNPHPDRLGNADVWHFYSEPDQGTGAETAIPPGSILARWMVATNSAQRASLATDLQTLLLSTTNRPAQNTPDEALRRQLTSISGPLFRGLLEPKQLATLRQPGAESKESPWGLPSSVFGPQPNATQTGSADIMVHAPSVLEVRVPREIADGCELVATARLHPQAGGNGSVQMYALLNRPSGAPTLTPGAVREAGNKSTWSDGDRPAASDSPILVRTESPARHRIESAVDEFRQLFPAALCYTKIVPVDEVVTLTLFYREDDHLRRLMLEEEAASELERLWTELHYVSHDALKLVDAFEQLWQFATQDADPSAFEPMREPIKRRAESFRRQLTDTQPAHLDAVVKFAGRAYRRPPTTAEESDLRALYQRLRAEEIPHDQAIRLTLARVLVAPAFLYRAEKPVRGEKPGPIDDWELATRLSYFLWSSAPDEPLLAAAKSGRLKDPAELTNHARRMLRDPRVRRLAVEFACTWLHVYAFDELGEKSDRHFPTFASLRSSMYEETIRFFTDLFQKDGSLLEIIDADHAYLNPGLAQHYGLPPLKSGGSEDGWQRVEGLRKLGRGGILAQATTLAKQSGASRTSPILRGNWVAEVLLGEKLPRPPKDVPRLPEDEATEQLTVRQLTEKHSNDPKCYGCHRRIDPYGYALEGFDPIGRSREKDLGGHPVDTRTRLMDGTDIEGLEGLKKYIGTQRRDAFLKQFCRKLLGYALGRGVLLSDGPLINEMRSQLKAHDYRLSAAFETIVRSRQFREIRGADMTTDE